MSRSIGDSVAAQVGVISEPEVLQVELTREHKFLILASDGVWEFISSQAVGCM
jgi:serine/threonine protein phosphatase PrpC